MYMYFDYVLAYFQKKKNINDNVNVNTRNIFVLDNIINYQFNLILKHPLLNMT